MVGCAAHPNSLFCISVFKRPWVLITAFQSRYSNRAYHFHRRWTLRKHFLAMRDRFFEIKAKENQQRYAAEVRAGLLAIEMAQSSEHVRSRRSFFLLPLPAGVVCVQLFCDRPVGGRVVAWMCAG